MEKEIELREEELETVKQQLDRVGEELERVEKIASIFQINITGLTVIDTGQYRGMTQYSTVNVTVQNFGAHDVRSLILSVRYTGGDSGGTKSISILKAGEAQTFTFNVTYSVLFTDESYIATLKAENVILDEYSYPPAI